MKKTLAILLATATVLGLSACGSSDTAESGAATEAEGTATETEAAAEGDAAEGGEAGDSAAAGDTVLKVVQPYDPGTFEPGNSEARQLTRSSEGTTLTERQ